MGRGSPPTGASVCDSDMLVDVTWGSRLSWSPDEFAEEHVTIRVIAPTRRLSFEVSMELDSIDPTSATLLGRSV